MGVVGYLGSILYALATAGMIYSAIVPAWSELSSKSQNQYPGSTFDMGLFRTNIDFKSETFYDNRYQTTHEGIDLDVTSYDFCSDNAPEVFSSPDLYCYLLSASQIGITVGAMLGFSGTVVCFLLASGMYVVNLFFISIPKKGKLCICI